MKKITLLLVLAGITSLFAIQITAQECTPDFTVVDTANPGQIEPDSLPPAFQFEYYDAMVTVIPPASAEVAGSQIELHSIIIDSIGNLPPGVEWFKNEDEFVVTDPESHYCVNLYGEPEEQGDYQLTLYITAVDAMFQIGTQVTDDTSINILVNAPVSTDAFGERMKEVSAYPNPYTQGTRISFESNKAGKASLSVYNLLGKLLYQENMEATSGKNSFLFSGTNLTAGTYIYTVEINGQKETSRLMKSR